MRVFAFLGLLLIGMTAASTAKAEELMNLWPNQRAAHLNDTEWKIEKYHSRGQEYVDFLYATHGAEPFPADPDMFTSEPIKYPTAWNDTPSIQNNVNAEDVQDVNVDQVQSMIDDQ